MTVQHSPPLLPLLLRQSQATLNRWIAQSTAARDEMRGLEDRSMIVAVENTSWRVRFSVVQQQVRLRQIDAETDADIVIQAGLFDLFDLMRAESLSGFRAGEVEFRGSLRVAESFSRLLRLARPRLEDELAGWIGGMPARVLAQSGDAARAWGARTAGAIEFDTVEYLQAETGELPYPDDVARFLREVERLRDDVDRIGQRIDRLTRRGRAVDPL
jgi:ubiquinone biosynthesis protein UbiJ